MYFAFMALLKSIGDPVVLIQRKETRFETVIVFKCLSLKNKDDPEAFPFRAASSTMYIVGFGHLSLLIL